VSVKTACEPGAAIVNYRSVTVSDDTLAGRRCRPRKEARLTTAVQQQLGVVFEQWATSTSAHLEGSQGAAGDYTIDVNCQAAELDAVTKESLQKLFADIAAMQSQGPSSELTLYRARGVELTSHPPEGAAIGWLKETIPELSPSTLYINLVEATPSSAADDFIHGFTFKHDLPGLMDLIRDLPVPVFGSMPSGLQNLDVLLRTGPLLGVTGQFALGTELALAHHPLMAIFVPAGAFLVSMVASQGKVIVEETTEASRRWWRRKLGLEPAPRPGPSGEVMATGTVKNFSSNKGYGFIKPDDEGKDIFVHASAIETPGCSELKSGQRVTYRIQEAQKGPQAANVRIVPSP
jgi:cold shock protein